MVCNSKVSVYLCIKIKNVHHFPSYLKCTTLFTFWEDFMWPNNKRCVAVTWKCEIIQSKRKDTFATFSSWTDWSALTSTKMFKKRFNGLCTCSLLSNLNWSRNLASLVSCWVSPVLLRPAAPGQCLYSCPIVASGAFHLLEDGVCLQAAWTDRSFDHWSTIGRLDSFWFDCVNP